MIEWFERGSYLGIIFFLTLTGIGLPVPEEVPIVAAGVASRAGALHWYYALPACLVGALLGDSLMYAIGRFFGARVLKEHPWWSGFLTAEREKTIEDLIKKHGIKAFFVARFLVGLRSPFYLTAGSLKVKYRWFLLADFICASVVIGGFFGLAYLFGDRITGLIQSAERGFTAVIIVAALAASQAALRATRMAATASARSDRGSRASASSSAPASMRRSFRTRSAPSPSSPSIQPRKRLRL
jgi:membrane protein DedA with SNARE-associated domain